MRALAFALLAALAAPLVLAEPDTVTLSCEPPRLANKVIVQPCSITANVAASFLITMTFSGGDVGAVEVDARGPGSTVVDPHRFVCPVAFTVAVCVGPITIEPAWAGTWTFKANPAVTDVGGSPYVKMEVRID